MIAKNISRSKTEKFHPQRSVFELRRPTELKEKLTFGRGHKAADWRQIVTLQRILCPSFCHNHITEHQSGI